MVRFPIRAKDRLSADTEQTRSVVRGSASRRRRGCRIVGRNVTGRYLAGVGPSHGRPVQKNSFAEWHWMCFVEGRIALCPRERERKMEINEECCDVCT